MKPSIDFIGIGAQKAGTTWLYHRLGELSDFKMPPIKEFHYFDNHSNYRPVDNLVDPILINRLKKINWSYKALRSLVGSILRNDIEKTNWLRRYYFSNYNNEWYISQFKTLKGITGEITPAYSVLHEDHVKNMYDLLPDLKLVFILRNPIDRVWSHYRHFSEIHKFNIEDEGSFLKFIKSRHLTLEKSDYLKSIDNYTKYFDKSQILFGYYDAIQEQPSELIKGIVDFLGGDSSKVAKECNLFEKSNVSQKLKITNEAKDFLVDQFYPSMEELSKLFGGYCTRWFTDLTKKNTEPKTHYPSYTFLK